MQYQFPFPYEYYDSRDPYGGLFERSSKHRGADFNGAVGPRWLNTSDRPAAVADGTVVFAGSYGCLGSSVVIQHADLKYSGYCHLSARAVYVGQTVSRGQPIGNIGNDGSCSGGVHLHLTMANTQEGALGGDPYYTNHFDPIAYIAQRLDPAPTTPPPVGEPMPVPFTTARDADFAVPKLTMAEADAVGWPILPYNDGVATNLAELQPTATTFNIVATFYITGLYVGETVTVRGALQAKTTNAVSGLVAATIPGSVSGIAKGQYVLNAQVPSTHRLLIQPIASTTGATIDLWRSSSLSW
ncbi:MAG: M23 family metallopeptidase [Agromyces sp.]